MASISRRQRRRLNKAERRRRRQRQTRSTRRVRRQLEQRVASVPAPAAGLLACLAAAFTRPTYLRFAVLLLAAVLSVGGRNVCKLLRTLGRLVPGDASSYHKVFSKRRWGAWRLARVLAGFVLRHCVPQG